MIVDAWEGNSVRIVVDDGFTAPSMRERTEPEATAEVAEYVQEQMDYARGWLTGLRHLPC